MGRTPGARASFDALIAEQRARVVEILAADIAVGYVPKESDINAAIAAVIRHWLAQDRAGPLRTTAVSPAPRGVASDGGAAQ